MPDVFVGKENFTAGDEWLLGVPVLDRTLEVFGSDPVPADLATLQADATYGDGNYEGAAFTTGQYVTLGDDSQAGWDGSVWTVGAA